MRKDEPVPLDSQWPAPGATAAPHIDWAIARLISDEGRGVQSGQTEIVSEVLSAGTRLLDARQQLDDPALTGRERIIVSFERENALRRLKTVILSAGAPKSKIDAGLTGMARVVAAFQAEAAGRSGQSAMKA